MKIRTIRNLAIAFLIIVLGILVLFFIIRADKKLESLREGKAAFHEYSFELVDSLLAHTAQKDLLYSLFIISEPSFETVLSDLADSSNRSFGGFLAEGESQVIPRFFDNYSSSYTPNFWLTAASNDGLKALAGDSVYIPLQTQFNSITDDNLYYSYNILLNGYLSSLGFKGKIMKIELPHFFDQKYYKNVTNRVKKEIDNLHEKYRISILDLRQKQLSEDSLVFLRQTEVFQDLIENGLCAAIFDNQFNLELFDSLEFDGLFIYQVNTENELNEKILELADIFVLPENETKHNLVANIHSRIKSRDRTAKLFRTIRAALWANQYQDTDFETNYVTEAWFKSNIAKESIILLKNSGNILPFININQSFLVINTTGRNIFHFSEVFKNYAVNASFVEYDFNNPHKITIPARVDHIVIISDDNFFTLTEENIRTLQNHPSTIYVHSGRNTAIDWKSSKAIVQIHEINDESLSYSAQLLFGGISAKGISNIHVNDTITFGYGLQTSKNRLEYTIPENAGLSSKKLGQIDTIIINAIASGAFPGAQVVVARKGMVVYEKSFGHHNYSRAIQVKDSDLYDIASITKIAATTLAAMKLHEQKKINLNNETGRYFRDTTIDYSNIPPDTLVFIDTLSIKELSKNEIASLVHNKDTLHINDTLIWAKETVISRVTPNLNIFRVPIRKLLVHQSGISPSLPIIPYISYTKTFQEIVKLREKEKNSNLIPFAIDSKTTPFNYFFSTKRIKDTAEILVTDKMYLRRQFADSIYQNVKRLRVYPNPRMQYTCMNMILLQMVIDSINNSNLDLFLKRIFYTSLGMINTTFNPINSITKARIIPTENDILWRKQLIHGTVHDSSAALLGGTAGNAGLFSTASDLAILGQMWLNGGNYGGRQYLLPETINTFTSKQPENNRGLGFDKPTENGIHAKSIPRSAYGHLGFTGCAMWIDPENKIVFVFLSNRIHPSVSNQRINALKIRQRVHQAVYDAIITSTSK